MARMASRSPCLCHARAPATKRSADGMAHSVTLIALLLIGVAPGTALGEVTPSPAPSCSQRSRPITLVTAKQPIYPASAKGLKLPAVRVLVTVTVSATGDVEKTHIFQSSGNADIDAAAMESAKGSTYLPQIVNCRAVEADGLFTADFRPD
jgi:TonB family protein